jgi:hypothetical protein
MMVSKKNVQVIVQSVDNETANKEVFDSCLDAVLRDEDVSR